MYFIGQTQLHPWIHTQWKWALNTFSARWREWVQKWVPNWQDMARVLFTPLERPSSSYGLPNFLYFWHGQWSKTNEGTQKPPATTSSATPKNTCCTPDAPESPTDPEAPHQSEDLSLHAVNLGWTNKSEVQLAQPKTVYEYNHEQKPVQLEYCNALMHPGRLIKQKFLGFPFVPVLGNLLCWLRRISPLIVGGMKSSSNLYLNPKNQLFEDKPHGSSDLAALPSNGWSMLVCRDLNPPLGASANRNDVVGYLRLWFLIRKTVMCIPLCTASIHVCVCIDILLYFTVVTYLKLEIE